LGVVRLLPLQNAGILQLNRYGMEVLTMSAQSKVILGAAAAIMAAGCAYTAPYQSSGPALSEQGVQVGVAGVRCYVNREGDPMIETGPGQEQVGLDVKLQISNHSDQVAELEEGHLRLADADTASSKAAPPAHSKVVAVLPGESKEVRLAFMPEGSADCRHNFALELADSVDVQGSPIPLSPIVFEPKP
jgi:hypothetical protein